MYTAAPSLLLFSEVVESGIVDAFAAQDGGDLSSLGAGIDETKDAQFLFAGVAASDRLGLGQMRLWREMSVFGARAIWHNRSRHNRLENPSCP